MAQPFEQVLEQIRNTTETMAQSLAAVAGSTQQTAAAMAAQQQQSVEKTRDLADISNEAQGVQESAGEGMGQLVEIMSQMRDCACECQCDDKGGGGGFGIGDAFKMLFGGGKQTGGMVYPAPSRAFAKGGGVYKVPGNSTGDNHDMMLPQGSFVLNREASKATGVQRQASCSCAAAP